jgi:hypothetical protein
MPMHGLQSLTPEMLPSLSDCIYSSIHRPRAPSYLLHRLHKMFILPPMRAWRLHLAWVDSHSYTLITAGDPSIALIPVDQAARSPIILLI